MGVTVLFGQMFESSYGQRVIEVYGSDFGPASPGVSAWEVDWPPSSNGAPHVEWPNWRFGRYGIDARFAR